MTETKATVDDWVLRIQKTRSSIDLLKLLSQFRKYEWTDLERQKISHTYMKVLDVILKDSAENLKVAEEAAVAAGAGNDGPVWYEKM